ncbi:HAD domain-containing protein [Duganella sp. S19_KUP01_CR8]|uniref:HAD domain-containing protein n=1 Tax=Duganella sp. S19_KUP01_CR8 TaxID=3025502 RepID=UPI002FCDDE96
MSVLVFLDIDDVLCVHPTLNTQNVLAALSAGETANAEEVWQQVFHAVARENLRQLHKEFLPHYVISSSWVLHLNREQLCDTFRLTGMAFVAENLHEYWSTPRDVNGDSYRLVEIENWLDTHALGTPVPFIVIDDVISGQSLVGSHLEDQCVLCNVCTGFMFGQLAQARSILQAQLTSVSHTRG